MTTKFKIIIGFLVMILLIGGMAVLGYRGLQQSTEGLESYRRQASVNVGTSDMMTHLIQTASRTFAFVGSFDPAEMELAAQSVADFEKTANAAAAETRIQYRKDAIADMLKQVQTIKALQATVRGSLLNFRQQYNDVVRKNYNIMADNLHELGSAAVTLQNYDAMYSLTLIWEEFSQCLSALGRFSGSFDDKDGETALNRILGVVPEFERLREQLMSEGGRKMYASLTRAHKELEESVRSMIVNGKASSTALTEIRAISREIQASMGELSARVDTEMRAVGAATLDSNLQAQRMMMIVSAIGVILGAALAAFIIFGIVRVLNDISRFAEATAKGDFSYQVRAREKGEIGVMVQSMQAIPAALKEILAEYQRLETSIEYGKLQAQGDERKFSGDFATLIRGTNAILGRFLTVLEHIPSPVVILDKDLKAAYLNTIARDLAGSDYHGKTCFQLFAREDFDSSSDALRKAVESKKPASSETIAHPQGRTMDISYNAIPMFDEEGRIASVMQLITDLTAIKSQQRIMMDVAHQASEISNRVAAASEELSAQVEQVSRGAEMQRSRVESTASAMTEMNSTVLEVARNAGAASEQSEKTRQKANDGASLVNQVVRAINQVNSVAMTLQGNMQELGTQAVSIGGVMNVIADIADQTNLLALNAAIEAARAGEAGRGFAVVADEVRKLAEKTMNATHEVGSSITAIQNSTKVNIEEVGSAVKNIAEATELANSSGTALSEIVELASSNSAVVASIATAAEQQSSASEEINKSIEEINLVVGETTEGMIQSSAAVQELSQMAQELRQVMSGLN